MPSIIKNELFKIYKSTPNGSMLKCNTFRDYVTERNRLRNRIKLAKEQYYSDKINENQANYKKTWSILREIIFQKPMNKNNNQKTSLKENGEVLSNDKDVANCLNNDFVNVGLSSLHIFDSMNNFERYMSHHSANTFSFSPIDDDVEKVVHNSLNSSAAVGIDKISVRFLKNYREVIAPKLSELTNCIIERSSFDDCLKVAKTIPLFKSGDKLSKNNYRPISILPALSKISEKILNQQLKSFMIQNQLISNRQFGFMPKCSTESASLELVNYVIRGLD